MIASVSGILGDRCPDHVVVDCGGVGYRLNVSAQTLKEMPAPGREAHLLAHLVVRDDSMQLYGFASEDERGLFGKLISVAGVGPKVALAVLSGSSARELTRAIAAGDAKRFQVAPGVGRKTAERIIVELREKIAAEGEYRADGADDAVDSRTLAREGLIGLGYDLVEAETMLAAAVPDAGEADADPEQLIATALKAAAVPVTAGSIKAERA